MRSKMLGLAIALSTFGLGVAATTLWIAYHTPLVPQEVVTTRTTFVPSELSAPAEGIKQGILKITCSMTGSQFTDPLPRSSPVRAGETRALETVVVSGIVDRSGNVVSAKAISGEPLLRQAATDFFKYWEFMPTHTGKSVATRQAIVFNCQHQ